MTNSLAERPQTRTPPREEWRGPTLISIVAALAGALLLVGAVIWPGGAALQTSAATSGGASSPPDLDSTAAASIDVADIAVATVDAIVVVNVTVDTRGPVDTSGSGSGVIISEDGTIITNAHVVDGATSISVELTDGSTLPATVLAQNDGEDIAVLKIEVTGLTTIELGSTEDLLVGNSVIAIGNPLALEGGPSVSTGIVSALDRELVDEEARLTGIIQTDAAITEGSSGGALLDSEGLLIGITTAVGVSSVGVEGIAFAVPVETVIGVLGDV